jgi:hypothetical protein
MKVELGAARGWLFGCLARDGGERGGSSPRVLSGAFGVGRERGGGEGRLFLSRFEEGVGRADDERVRRSDGFGVLAGVVDAGEETAHGFETGPALVVALHDGPGRVFGIGGTDISIFAMV